MMTRLAEIIGRTPPEDPDGVKARKRKLRKALRETGMPREEDPLPPPAPQGATEPKALLVWGDRAGPWVQGRLLRTCQSRGGLMGVLEVADASPGLRARSPAGRQETVRAGDVLYIGLANVDLPDIQEEHIGRHLRIKFRGLRVAGSGYGFRKFAVTEVDTGAKAKPPLRADPLDDPPR